MSNSELPKPILSTLLREEVAKANPAPGNTSSVSVHVPKGKPTPPVIHPLAATILGSAAMALLEPKGQAMNRHGGTPPRRTKAQKLQLKKLKRAAQRAALPPTTITTTNHPEET